MLLEGAQALLSLLGASGVCEDGKDHHLQPDDVFMSKSESGSLKLACMSGIRLRW